MDPQLTAAHCLVSSIMTKDFEVVRDTLDVNRLTKRLLARKLSCAAVSDGSGDLIGFVSMNDLVRDGVDRPHRNGSNGTSGNETPRVIVSVRDIMTPGGVVLRIEADASIGEAARLMATAGVHRIIVVADMRVVGMVSALDILTWLADSATSAAAASSSAAAGDENGVGENEQNSKKRRNAATEHATT